MSVRLRPSVPHLFQNTSIRYHLSSIIYSGGKFFGKIGRISRSICRRDDSMKRALLLTVAILAFSAAAFGQAVENASRSTIGYIRENGTVENAGRSTIGYIQSDGTVENSGRATIGYVRSDGTVENKNRSTIGYIRSDGTIENKSRSTLGYVRSDGAIENSSRSTIGYAKGVKPEHAAAFFFFFFKPE